MRIESKKDNFLFLFIVCFKSYNVLWSLTCSRAIPSWFTILRCDSFKKVKYKILDFYTWKHSILGMVANLYGEIKSNIDHKLVVDHYAEAPSAEWC
jgi:hypothetical protein